MRMLLALVVATWLGLSGGEARKMPTLYGPDVDVYITVVDWPRWGDWDQIDLLARVQIVDNSGDPTDFVPDSTGNLFNGYRLRFFEIDTNEVMGWIERCTINGGGGGTAISSTFFRTVADGDKFGLRCVGTAITAWHYDGSSWTQIASATDSTYQDAGFVGLHIPGNHNDTNTSDPGLYDDFGAGTITGASFPEAGIADDFNRADGPIGSGWQGLYRITGSGAPAAAIDTNRATNGDFSFPDGSGWTYLFSGSTPTPEGDPPIDESTPCCGDRVPPGTPGGVGDTPPDDPFRPLQPWIPACAGGGTVPSAADLTDSESWA